jgi:hypothetical protein
MDRYGTDTPYVNTKEEQLIADYFNWAYNKYLFHMLTDYPVAIEGGFPVAKDEDED